LAVSADLSCAAETSIPKNFLVLYSFTDRRALNGIETLKSATRFHAGSPVSFQIECLESQRFKTLRYESGASEALAGVYEGKRIDLVIAFAYPALRFAMEHHGKYVIGGLILILIQASIIIGLLLRRARERKSEINLLESEQRFRLMADTTPALVWMCDSQGNVTYLNQRRIDFTGRDPAASLGDVWSAFIHPDDLQSVWAANTLALERQEGFSKEYRLRRRDGEYRWMLDVAAPRIDSDGSFAGFIGSAVDITDQKSAREALEKIGGKLVEAQEEERSRIARELHDDICQRLALLSMELEQANRASNGSTVSPNQRMEEIRQHCAEIAGDVQALSHKLHSSKLEYLGVGAAIRGFCREFCQQNDVNIQFAEENLPDSLPRDISLSLFRVTQEALQNALKHSGVSQFSVSLRGTADEIQLDVSDEGKGFDVEAALLEKGLGLVSMQERVHLVHGILTIKSTAKGGTRLLVRVPLAAEIKASRTATDNA
jgi:PAS domain S-box-containing protein